MKKEVAGSMGKVSSSKDLIMLLLYARGHKGEACEPIRGRTRLMKMVFLFDKEIRRKFNLEKAIPDGAMPDFTPYDYGPFSAQVFGDVEFLIELGFVEVRRADDSEPLPEESLEYEYWQAGAGSDVDEEGPTCPEEFSLTDLGRGFVEEGKAGVLTKEKWAVLDEFKARCTGASLRALLRYVYTKYPKWTTESKIRNEVLSGYKF
jgi:hypothetical protein